MSTFLKICFCWPSKAILLQFVSLLCSSVVVIIHNVIQVNLKFFYALISFLSEGNRVAFIYEGFIEPFYVPLVQGCFTWGGGVPYPKSVACLLQFVIWYCFLMPGGRLCSTIGKDSLYLYWSNLLGKMMLYNVCRNLGRFVIINVSCSKRGSPSNCLHSASCIISIRTMKGILVR